ncbi:hypothetical protein ACFVUN_27230 [Kitasatospora griseola]|uniref:hypothetical protein n=1 Tax=Kitasatospora griseola TaxID=2064 RepID=UPI0036DDFF19
MRAWLWRVVIADGTHALPAAGRWNEALRHIEEHRGIGLRVLDGRRVAVLAAASTGDQRAVGRMIDHCLALEPDKGMAVITTRLALTAIDAAAVRNLLVQLTSRTGEAGDGYALRDLLTHDDARSHLDPGLRKTLERALAACALDSGVLPGPVRDHLEESLDRAGKVLEMSLFDPGSPGGRPFEQRARTAPSSVASPHVKPSNLTT